MKALPPLAAFLAAALLAGCSPEGAPAAEGNGREALAEPANRVEPGPPRASGGAKAEMASADPSGSRAARAGERRCGWLVNPTPGNWWLDDADGQWVLATQGSEGAPGMDDMPDMSVAGWVETNGHYGYGCACMTLAHDPSTKRVTRIADARPRPLAQCRADKRLKRPE